MIALTLARRELRTGVRGLRIVLACLALGVAAITAVGTLRAGITAGLEENGRAMLGGDLEIQSGAQPLPPELTNWLHARAATTSDVITMRSMLIAPNGERQLIELKAVDPAYPLVGTIDPAPPHPGTISADQVLLDRLATKPGNPLRLGLSTLTAGPPIVSEPDRGAATGLFAPRALIALSDLPATGLVQPGSLLNYDLRATIPPTTSPTQLVQDLRKAFPEQSWRIRLSTEAAPGIARFIDQTSLFLTLVGLTALLVGGIGVATGIRAWLEARSRSIATLRCLGAPTSTIFATYLIQVAALCTIGIVLGTIAGAALTAAAEYLFRDSLPIPARIGLYPAPILLAVAYGLLVAGAFALIPLARAAQIPGAALFRDDLTPRRLKSRPLVLAANAAIAAALVALLVAASPDRAFALWFCIAAAATLLLFRAGATALMALSRRAPTFRNVSTRLGIANLHRPGASTPLMLVSLGLGLSTLATVALIQGNIRAQVLEQLPAVAPTFFFIDLQNDQIDRFQSILRAQPGVEQVAEVPSLRARLVSVNGVPADQVRATPETQWALRGDRGLTYAHAPPEGNHLTQGEWWPQDYQGPPLVSFDANLAKGWNVHIGDTIRVNVLGRDIDLTVKNLRDIAWRSLSLNFAMVASPGLLERAPHGHIATVRTTQAAEAPTLRAVTDAFPNVTGIRVADVLGTIADLVGKLAAALAATGSVTLAAGALVLVGAVAAGQRRRTADAVVLKAIGATAAQIRTAWLTEFGIIGAAAGLIAALVGTASSWAVTRFVMHADWVFLPGTLAATILGCTALMLLFGYIGTSAALRARAAPLLRNE